MTVQTSREAEPAPQRRPGELERRVLAALSAAVVALAPVEGYLMWLHPQLAKVPAVLLIGAWAILRWRIKPVPVPHIVYVLLAALAAVVLISTAVHLDSPFATLYAARWIPFLVLTAALVDLASAVTDVRVLLASAVAGTTAAALGGLYSVLALGQTRAGGPNTDPNDLACTLVAVLPLALVFSPRRLLTRVVLALAVAAIVLAAAATLSRGGLVALAAAVAWLVARRALPAHVTLWAAAGSVVVGLVIGVSARTKLVHALSQKQYIGERNIDTRLLRWRAALRMLGEHPILGVGPGGFRSHYPSTSGMAEIDIPAQQLVAHNMYLEVAAELGVLGLVVVLALIATAFLSVDTTFRNGVSLRLSTAIQASLIANAVAVVFLSGQYFFSLWFAIAMACAVGIRARTGRRV